MDVETSNAIESLRGDIQRVEHSLVRVETTLREQMFQKFDELKRHADIRFDGLQDDIRLLAEGFAALSAKLDAFNRPR